MGYNSVMNKGKDNPFYGKHHTEETKRKILISRYGRDMRIHKNEIIKMYKDGKTSYEIADKFNVSRSFITSTLKRNGVKMRIGAPKKGITPWNKGKPYYAIRGEKNHNWKGGITSLNQKIRHCIKYKNWFRTVFKRDNWTCRICDKRGGDLEADHYPKKFHKIISDNNIKSYQDAILCDEMWDINNGRTLCLKCHNKTKSNCNLE